MPYITFKNENALYHAEKGSTWSNHKYVRIENGRYIYPEDLEGNKGNTSSVYSQTSKNLKSAARENNEANYKKYMSDYKKQFDSSVDNFRVKLSNLTDLVKNNSSVSGKISNKLGLNTEAGRKIKNSIANVTSGINDIREECQKIAIDNFNKIKDILADPSVISSKKEEYATTLLRSLQTMYAKTSKIARETASAINKIDSSVGTLTSDKFLKSGTLDNSVFKLAMDAKDTIDYNTTILEKSLKGNNGNYTSFINKIDLLIEGINEYGAMPTLND